MSTTKDIENLASNERLRIELSLVQDIQELQSQYNEMVRSGIAQKRSYNLAAANNLGVHIPGQTTYKIDL